MLENAYPFLFIQNMEDEQHVAKLVKMYRFKSTKSNLTYIVRVEVYQLHVYAIKFYLKTNRNSPNKYKLTTNTNEPLRIINTCINIMLSICQDDAKTSFGFIGSNGMDEDTYCCTKRYRVYSKIMARRFSDEKFYHMENKGKSTYLMLNREMLRSNPNMVNDIQKFFASQYDYFD